MCCKYNNNECNFCIDDISQNMSDTNSKNECHCCLGKSKVKGKFGLAYIVNSPKHKYCEPLGWQIEFRDAPSKVDQNCKKLMKWVNCPPLGECNNKKTQLCVCENILKSDREQYIENSCKHFSLIQNDNCFCSMEHSQKKCNCESKLRNCTDKDKHFLQQCPYYRLTEQICNCHCKSEVNIEPMHKCDCCTKRKRMKYKTKNMCSQSRQELKSCNCKEYEKSNCRCCNVERNLENYGEKTVCCYCSNKPSNKDKCIGSCNVLDYIPIREVPKRKAKSDTLQYKGRNKMNTDEFIEEKSGKNEHLKRTDIQTQTNNKEPQDKENKTEKVDNTEMLTAPYPVKEETDLSIENKTNLKQTEQNEEENVVAGAIVDDSPAMKVISEERESIYYTPNTSEHFNETEKLVKNPKYDAEHPSVLERIKQAHHKQMEELHPTQN